MLASMPAFPLPREAVVNDVVVVWVLISIAARVAVPAAPAPQTLPPRDAGSQTALAAETSTDRPRRVRLVWIAPRAATIAARLGFAMKHEVMGYDGQGNESPDFFFFSVNFRTASATNLVMTWTGPGLGPRHLPQVAPEWKVSPPSLFVATEHAERIEKK